MSFVGGLPVSLKTALSSTDSISITKVRGSLMIVCTMTGEVAVAGTCAAAGEVAVAGTCAAAGGGGGAAAGGGGGAATGWDGGAAAGERAVAWARAVAGSWAFCMSFSLLMPIALTKLGENCCTVAM